MPDQVKCLTRSPAGFRTWLTQLPFLFRSRDCKDYQQYYHKSPTTLCVFKASVFGVMQLWDVKETPQSDHSRDSLAVALPGSGTFWDRRPFPGSSDRWVPAWLPTHPPHITPGLQGRGGRVPDVSFHKAIYLFLGSDAQTARAGASKEGPQQRNPWDFIPSQPPRGQSRSSSQVCGSCPHLRVHPPGWHHPSSSPLLSERSAIPGCCCVSVSSHLAGVTHLCAFCHPKGQQFIFLSRAPTQSSTCTSTCI